MFHTRRFTVSLSLVLMLFLGGCGNIAIKPTPSQPSDGHTTSCQCQNEPPIALPEPSPQVKPTVTPTVPLETTKVVEYSLLKPANWKELETFNQDELQQAWPAWLQSCSALKTKPAWQRVCDLAQSMNNPSKWPIATYFKQNFNLYTATNVDGSDTGMVTGYYEPLLRGSRQKSERYRYPIYFKPDDLLTIDLTSVFPELANKRVRGRLVGNKVLPYYPRSEIESANSPLAGHELVWADDIIDVFFLQIQGSGVIRLDTGESMHVGYADQNGQAYQSIGKVLIDRGELTADKASMQGIKAWGRNNPDKLRDLLNTNPSYVFFRELPAGLPGPYGALGVPLLAERAAAVDQRYVPLGAPIFLSTTFPNTSKPLNRLLMAQDTGGAIKGGVRVDYFWGFGDDATRQAGSMKQSGKVWVLLPKEFVLPATNGTMPSASK